MAALPALLLGGLSICTGAGQCFKVTKSFIETYGPSLTSILSTGLTVKEKSFQYTLLASELKMTIEILEQYDATIRYLKDVQKQYQVQICALQMATDVSNQTHALLENFADTKLNLALMKKDPEYYRQLLQNGVAYMTSSMVALNTRSKNVLQAVKSAQKIKNEDRRQMAFQQLRNAYNMC